MWSQPPALLKVTPFKKDIVRGHLWVVSCVWCCLASMVTTVDVDCITMIYYDVLVWPPLLVVIKPIRSQFLVLSHTIIYPHSFVL